MASLPGSFPLALPAVSAPQNISSRAVKKWLGREHSGGPVVDALTAVPAQFGSVRSVKIPKGQPVTQVVLHIQDVHLNAEAQKNISSTIQVLIQKKATGLIALEGASSSIDLNFFRSFPHRESIQTVADYLLRKNKISGAIHAGFVSQKEIPTYAGIDDAFHYAANIRAVQEAAPLKEKLLAQVGKDQQGLAEEKKNKFNPKLLGLDDLISRYHSGRLEMGAYVEALARTNSSLPLSVSTFLEAFNLERSLNFSQVEHERTLLLNQLMPKLDHSQAASLMETSLAFRTGVMNHADFYQYLLDLCKKNEVPLQRYKAMDDYLLYLLLSDSIDSELLMQDVRALENSTYASLAQTAEERQLVQQSKRLELSRKLLDFSLTKAEWGEYEKEVPGNWKLEIGSRKGNPFEDFYKEAEARDERMAHNFIELSTNFQLPSAAALSVLITGGFHSQGIDQRLVEAGAAVITFVPKITKVEDKSGSAYLSVFSQKKTPLDKLFAGEKLFLSLPILPSESQRLSIVMLVACGLRSGKSFELISAWFQKTIRSLSEWTLKGFEIISNRVEITISSSEHLFKFLITFGDKNQIQQITAEPIHQKIWMMVWSFLKDRFNRHFEVFYFPNPFLTLNLAIAAGGSLRGKFSNPMILVPVPKMFILMTNVGANKDKGRESIYRGLPISPVPKIWRKKLSAWWDNVVTGSLIKSKEPIDKQYLEAPLRDLSTWGFNDAPDALANLLALNIHQLRIGLPILKAVVQEAIGSGKNITHEMVGSILGKPDELYRLLRYLSPYRERAQKEKEDLVTFAEGHDWVYYLLWALKPKNQEPLPITVNIDPHSDLIPQGEGIDTVNPTHWVSSALRDGLAKDYFNIDLVNGVWIKLVGPGIDQSLLTVCEIAEVICELKDSNRPYILTVDADTFSLVDYPSGFASKKLVRHMPSSAISLLLRVSFKLMRLVGAPPLRVVGAISPDYIDPVLADEVWQAEFKEVVRSLSYEIFYKQQGPQLHIPLYIWNHFVEKFPKALTAPVAQLVQSEQGDWVTTLNEDALEALAQTLTKVLGRPLTVEDVRQYAAYHEALHRFIKQAPAVITRLRNQFKAKLSRKEFSKLKQQFANNYLQGNLGMVDEQILLEELLVVSVTERNLLGQKVRLLKTKKSPLDRIEISDKVDQILRESATQLRLPESMLPYKIPMGPTQVGAFLDLLERIWPKFVVKNRNTDLMVAQRLLQPRNGSPSHSRQFALRLLKGQNLLDLSESTADRNEIILHPFLRAQEGEISREEAIFEIMQIMGAALQRMDAQRIFRFQEVSPLEKVIAESDSEGIGPAIGQALLLIQLLQEQMRETLPSPQQKRQVIHGAPPSNGWGRSNGHQPTLRRSLAPISFIPANPFNADAPVIVSGGPVILNVQASEGNIQVRSPGQHFEIFIFTSGPVKNLTVGIKDSWNDQIEFHPALVPVDSIPGLTDLPPGVQLSSLKWDPVFSGEYSFYVWADGLPSRPDTSGKLVRLSIDVDSGPLPAQEEMANGEKRLHQSDSMPGVMKESMGPRGSKEILVVFPPAGSSLKGLPALLKNYPFAFDVVRDINEIVNRVFTRAKNHQFNLMHTSLDMPQDPFTTVKKSLPWGISNQIQNMALQLVAWEVFKRNIGLPQALMGVSRGFYSAAFAAGSISLEDAVTLLVRNSEYLFLANTGKNLRYVVVMGVPQEALEGILTKFNKDHPSRNPAARAIYGAPIYQIVVLEDFKRGQGQSSLNHLKRALESSNYSNAKVMEVSLPGVTHYPFFDNLSHAPLIAGAHRHYQTALQAIGRIFQPPTIPLYSENGKLISTSQDFVGDQSDTIHTPISWGEATQDLLKKHLNATFLTMLGANPFVLNLQKKYGMLGDKINIGGAGNVEEMIRLIDQFGVEKPNSLWFYLSQLKGDDYKTSLRKGWASMGGEAVILTALAVLSRGHPLMELLLVSGVLLFSLAHTAFYLKLIARRRARGEPVPELSRVGLALNFGTHFFFFLPYLLLMIPASPLITFGLVLFVVGVHSAYDAHQMNSHWWTSFAAEFSKRVKYTAALGKPGSGKGTLLKRFVVNLNKHLPSDKQYVILTMGDIFRAAAEKVNAKKENREPNKDIVGIYQGLVIPDEAVQAMESGKILNDDLAIKVLNEVLRMAVFSQAHGIFFDGFPRSKPQQDALNEKRILIKGAPLRMDFNFILDIHDETIRTRARKRVKEAIHQADKKKKEAVIRKDDLPEKVEARILDYQEISEPVVEAKRGTSDTIDLDAELPIGDVYREFLLNVQDWLQTPETFGPLLLSVIQGVLEIPIHSRPKINIPPNWVVSKIMGLKEQSQDRLEDFLFPNSEFHLTKGTNYGVVYFHGKAVFIYRETHGQAEGVTLFNSGDFDVIDKLGHRFKSAWNNELGFTSTLSLKSLISHPYSSDEPFVVFKGVHDEDQFDGVLFRDGIRPKPGSHVLDMGSGHGLNGILAAKLGAKRITAVDKFWREVINTRLNARLSSLMRHVSLQSDLFIKIPPNEKFDHIYFDIPVVRGHKSMLDGPDDPRLFDSDISLLDRFFKEANPHLEKDGTLELTYLEIPEFFQKVYQHGYQPIAIEGASNVREMMRRYKYSHFYDYSRVILVKSDKAKSNISSFVWSELSKINIDLRKRGHLIKSELKSLEEAQSSLLKSPPFDSAFEKELMLKLIADMLHHAFNGPDLAPVSNMRFDSQFKDHPAVQRALKHPMIDEVNLPNSLLFLILMMPDVYRNITRAWGEKSQAFVLTLSMAGATVEGLLAILLNQWSGQPAMGVWLIILALMHFIFEWSHPNQSIRAPPLRPVNVVRLFIFSIYFLFPWFALSPLLALPFQLLFDWGVIHYYLRNITPGSHLPFDSQQPKRSEGAVSNIIAAQPTNLGLNQATVRFANRSDDGNVIDELERLADTPGRGYLVFKNPIERIRAQIKYREKFDSVTFLMDDGGEMAGLEQELKELGINKLTVSIEASALQRFKKSELLACIKRIQEPGGEGGVGIAVQTFITWHFWSRFLEGLIPLERLLDEKENNWKFFLEALRNA